jgi:hypothetical protein
VDPTVSVGVAPNAGVAESVVGVVACACAVYAGDSGEFASILRAAFSIAFLEQLHVKLWFYEKVHFFYPLFFRGIRGFGSDADSNSKPAGFAASVHRYFSASFEKR